MYDWAHNQALQFVNASPDEYACIFIGSGSTAAINRVARVLSGQRPQRDEVLISVMEHHSNDLPHRENHTSFAHIPCMGISKNLGSIDLEELENRLCKSTNYFAVTAASNVTGIINPIHEAAKLCHHQGAYIVVDASQAIAHRAINMDGHNEDGSDSIDALVFSGHKIYAPGSPGVLIIRRSLLANAQPSEFGGGMVDHVFKESYTTTSDLTAREEAGTPNILGAVTLAMSLNTLSKIGMETIAEHEKEIINYLFHEFKRIGEITIYGDNDLTLFDRTATISFNINNIDHALLAAILNDYFNIALRNQCFCAHPYVREMILEQLWELDPELSESEIEAKKGMVRASFALNNTVNDAKALVSAIESIVQSPAQYTRNYTQDEAGNYIRANANIDWTELFCPKRSLENHL